jgi:hypothetical protein
LTSLSVAAEMPGEPLVPLGTGLVHPDDGDFLAVTGVFASGSVESCRIKPGTRENPDCRIW